MIFVCVYLVHDDKCHESPKQGIVLLKSLCVSMTVSRRLVFEIKKYESSKDINKVQGRRWNDKGSFLQV